MVLGFSENMQWKSALVIRDGLSLGCNLKYTYNGIDGVESKNIFKWLNKPSYVSSTVMHLGSFTFFLVLRA